ncbi:MAG: PrsW family intramembrane metalloprotease [Candidatus Omnitrophica bacterium]|nr:PrsW family intramembrane metalloprotease [Candidatus Omnitrophota bacterium]
MKIQILMSFVMAAVPSLLLTVYFYRQDKRSPEPKRLILKIFLLGVIFTFPVYILETIISRTNIYFSISPFLFYFFEAFVVAGLCEEYIKLGIVKRYVYHDRHFNEVMDGIVYAVVASLGFACMENILYVLNGTWRTALARAFTAVPMHAVCSGMMGYYVGLAKFATTKKREEFLISRGFWQAVLIHGTYNLLLFVSPMPGLIYSLCVVMYLFCTFLKLKDRMRRAQKYYTKIKSV